MLDENTLVRLCDDGDVASIEAIINEAARVYRNLIPPDCWQEPYMPVAELVAELARGVRFWGCQQSNGLVGIMGLEKVADASLIRHAYIRPKHQQRGIGSALLTIVARQVKGTLMVGTWAAANWAIRFYERHGFRLVSEEEKDRLISTYWCIPLRQQQASVVLVRC